MAINEIEKITHAELQKLVEPAGQVVACQDERAWRNARSERLTGSRTAAAIGFAEREYEGSPVSVWEDYQRERRGEFDDSPTIEMEEGTAMQPYIARRYARETGVRLLEAPPYTIVRSVEHDWLQVTLDYVAVHPTDNHRLVECKFSSVWDAWEDGESPMSGLVQVVTQMVCTGMNGDLVGRVGRDLHIRPQELGKTTAFVNRVLIPQGRLFWGCVVNGVMPQIDGSDATTKTLKRLFKQVNDDDFAVVPGAEQIEARWRELNDQIQAAEGARDVLKNQVAARLGNGKYGTDENGVTMFRREMVKGFPVPARYQESYAKGPMLTRKRTKEKG